MFSTFRVNNEFNISTLRQHPVLPPPVLLMADSRLPADSRLRVVYWLPLQNLALLEVLRRLAQILLLQEG